MIKSGDRLGRFELKNELGRGSHGAVFEAVDVLLGERVAIKCLQPWLSGDVTLRERFKRELVLTRRVSHPGVCRLHDLHEEEGVLFISMQHIEGKSLSQVLRAEHPSQDRVIQILRGVCAALTAAHAEGVVHRDLKPANIMITSTDKVVVLDFGIATATGVGQLTRPGEAMGSVPYVPPEVWTGEAASAKGDQYALGVTGYVCLTLELPYTGKSALDVLDAIRGVRPTIRARFAEVDLDLEAAIMKAMAINPHERFETIGAFDDALRRIAERRAAGMPASPTPEAALAFLAAPSLWSVSSSLPSVSSSLSGQARVPSGALPLPVELAPASTDPTLTLTASLEAQLAPPPRITAVTPELAPSPTPVPVTPTPPPPAPRATLETPAIFDAATGQDADDPLTVPSSAFVLTNDRIPTSDTPPAARVLSTEGFEERTAIVDRRARPAPAAVIASKDDDEPIVVPGSSKKGPLAAVAGLVLAGVVLVVVGTSKDTSKDSASPTAITEPAPAPAPAPAPPPATGVPPPPPVDAPPADAPPVDAPPVDAPPADAPPGDLVMPDEPGAGDPVNDGADPAAVSTPKRASGAPLDVVAAAAAKRGIRPGDAAALDAALARGRTAVRANDKAGVDAAAKAARSALDAVVVDKGFVSEKLARFNKAFDGVVDPATKEKLRPLAREVLGRVSKADWAEANRQLNDGMTLIARTRTKKP